MNMPTANGLLAALILGDLFKRIVVVPRAGIEPALLSEPHFECGASTSSANGAQQDKYPVGKGGSPMAEADTWWQAGGPAEKGLYHGLANPRKEELSGASPTFMLGDALGEELDALDRAIDALVF